MKISLFKELEGLPPRRTHDHHIILKEGAQLVNVRLYRLGGLQKDVIEIMTKKMMEGGFIRILVVVALISSPMIDSSQEKKMVVVDICVLIIIYRDLNNNIIIQDKYRLPIIEELLDVVFCKIEIVVTLII